MKKITLFLFLITGLVFTVQVQAGENTSRINRLKKACDGGDAGGCTNLGLMYVKGTGVRQDKHKAVQFYTVTSTRIVRLSLAFCRP